MSSRFFTVGTVVLLLTLIGCADPTSPPISPRVRTLAFPSKSVESCDDYGCVVIDDMDYFCDPRYDPNCIGGYPSAEQYLDVYDALTWINRSQCADVADAIGQLLNENDVGFTFAFSDPDHALTVHENVDDPNHGHSLWIADDYNTNNKNASGDPYNLTYRLVHEGLHIARHHSHETTNDLTAYDNEVESCLQH
jgi:hypothetical protein